MKQDTNTVADARDLAFAQHVWKELKTLPIILPDNFTTVGEAYAKLQEFIFDRDIDREKQDRICDAFDKFEGAMLDLEHALKSAGVRRGGK
jgi:hypothetical protein